MTNDEIFSSTAEDHSLIGSPLRDSDMDSISNMIKSFSKSSNSKPWKDEDESFGPIEVSLARQIIAKANVFGKQLAESGWIVTFTKSPGPRNATTFILSTCLSNDGYYITGSGNYHGVVKRNARSIEQLVKCHLDLLSFNQATDGRSKANIETRTESYFAITPNITLKFLNYASTPSFNHVDKSSEVTLFQNIEIGKGHVHCENLWSQIQLLNLIKCDIVNCKNGSFDGSINADPLYRHGLAEMTFDKLQENIRRILTEIQERK